MSIPCEIVAVDDASTDRTPSILDEARLHKPLVVRHHTVNRGKGGAVRTGLEAASGDLCLVFDADLECDSTDVPRLLDAFYSERVDAVYGVRTFASHGAYSFWHILGNRGITLFANMLYNSYIRDVETCLKLVPTASLRAMKLRSETYTIEAEITAKLLRSKARIFEVPVTYRARSRAQGKKLLARDGFIAIAALLRYRMTPPIPEVATAAGDRS